MKSKIIKIISVVLAFLLIVGAGNLLFVAIKKHIKNIEAEKKLIAERSVADIADIFHDQGYIYMTPSEPSANDTVTVRLSTLKYNVTKAQLCYSLDEGETFTTVDMKYDRVSDGGYYDLWEAEIPPQAKKYRYLFRVANKDDKNKKFYSASGVTEYQPDVEGLFTVDPGFTTPDWSKGTYWYAINVGSFYNADSTNDGLSYINDRASGSGTSGSNDFYGGDLKGIVEKIEYIKSLGVESIYLNPIWPSNVITGYGAYDYYSVNPQFGTEQDLMDFVAACHKNDMKVMLDAVATYNTDFSNWYNLHDIYPLAGAYQSENSAFYDLFKFYKWPVSVQKVFSSFATNFSTEATKNAYYKTKDAYLTRYLNNETYNIDAWRFDAQDFLWGEDDTFQEIGRDIKPYVKAFGDDILYLGEIYTEDIAEMGIWESLWNNNLCTGFRNLMSSGNMTAFKKVCYSKVHTHPRPLAESMYTYLDGHDWDRASSVAGSQHQMDTGVLALMTYIGSPSVWYGDDIGSTLTTSDRMNGFNWDESTWKYDNYYLHLALGQLRKDYNSTMRKGVIKWGEIDDPKRFGTYARFDENATVIVALNNKPTSDIRDIDVSLFDIKDGTIITDYLTGLEYEVKNGKINADVLAGGTVFVTDGKCSEYREAYKLYSDSKNKNKVEYTTSLETRTTIKVEGNGVVDAKKDSGTFVQTPAFDTFKISAQVDTDKKSKVAITVTDSETVGSELRYSAELDGENLKVYARNKKDTKAKLITETKVKNGSLVSVERSKNNEFSVYVESNGTNKKINKSTVYIPMKSKVFAGFVSVKGNTVFSKIQFEDKEISQYAEDFEGSKTNSAFDLTGTAKINNGILEVSKANAVNFNTDMPASDYTVKTLIKSKFDVSEKGYVGLYTGNLNTDAVFTGLVGNKLVLSRIINGEFVVYDSVDVSNDKDITIQLQKTGNFFTAVYKFGDGKWQQFSTRIFSNYFTCKVGAVTESAKCDIDYITFGNAVNDGGKINTPISLNGYIADEDYSAEAYVTDNRSWKIDGDKSSWEYVTGGIAQNSVKGVHTMYENNTFADFRAETSLILDEGSGYAGMFVRGSEPNYSDNNGYVIKLYNDGKLTVSKNGNVLNSKTFDKIPSTGLRVVVEAVNDRIVVLAGNPLQAVAVIDDAKANNGYFGCFTVERAARFTNYALYRLDAEFDNRVNIAATNRWSFKEQSINRTAGETEYAYLSRKGIGYTDAAAFVQISATTNVSDTEEKDTNSYAGLAFAGNEGINPKEKGIFFGISVDGKVVVIVNGKLEEEAIISNYNQEVNNLFVTVKNGIYSVYVNNLSNALITYEADSLDGGTVSLVAFNAKAEFSHFYTEDLSNIDIEESAVKKAASKVKLVKTTVTQ